MPDAGDEKDGKEVEQGAPPAFAVSAQRDVEVFPEPGAQRDVPPPPELGDRAGEVGEVEVFLHANPEQFAQADGDVRVGGKVVVNLQHIQKGDAPGGGLVHPDAEVALDLGDERAEDVRQNQLFGKADDDAVEPVQKERTVKPALVLIDKGNKVLPLGNRAGDDLREEGQVQRRVEQAPRLCIPAGDVHKIGHRRKGDERDAQRRDDAAGGDGERKQAVDRRDRKVVVLKVDKHQHHNQHRAPRRQQLRRRPLWHPGDDAPEQKGQQHIPHQPQRPIKGRPGVKHHACADQEQVGQAQPPQRSDAALHPCRQIVAAQAQREKDK